MPIMTLIRGTVYHELHYCHTGLVAMLSIKNQMSPILIDSRVSDRSRKDKRDAGKRGD